MTKETFFDHPRSGHVGMLAYDSVNDRWQVVHVDATGQLSIDLGSLEDLLNALDSVGTDELDVNIEESVALDTQLHGYISSAWQKLPMLWGFSDRVAETVSETNTSAGTNIIYSTEVPSGEVHVIQSVTAISATASSTLIRIATTDDTNFGFVLDEQSPSDNIPCIWTGEIVLKAGDKIRGTFVGCTAAKAIYMYVWGYKLDVDL